MFNKIISGFMIIVSLTIVAAFVCVIGGVVSLGVTNRNLAGRSIELPAVPVVHSQDEAVNVLSKFGEVKSKYFPDGSWRVWMSGSRVVADRKGVFPLFKVDDFLSDRQCLQFTFLNANDVPVLSQVSKLEVGVADTGRGCPELVSYSSGGFFFYNSSKDRMITSVVRLSGLDVISPRVDEIRNYNSLVKNAFDSDALSYMLADPAKKSVPLKDRIPVPEGWSVEVVSDSVARVLPPASKVQWAKSWNEDFDDVKPLLGWLVVSDFSNGVHKSCLLYVRDSISCK